MTSSRPIVRAASTDWASCWPLRFMHSPSTPSQWSGPTRCTSRPRSWAPSPSPIVADERPRPCATTSSRSSANTGFPSWSTPSITRQAATLRVTWLRSASRGCSPTIHGDRGHADRRSESTLRGRRKDLVCRLRHQLAELLHRLDRRLEPAGVDAGAAAEDPALGPGTLTEPPVQVHDLPQRSGEHLDRFSGGHLLAELEQPAPQL